MRRRIVSCPTQEDLFEAAAQVFVQSFRSRSNPAQFFSVALSGGSTPRGLFAQLIADPYRSQVNWQSLKIFWGDERSVPPDHPESNYCMAKESFLDHLPIPSEHVFRMEGEGSSQESAVRYQEVMKKAFSQGGEGIPCFDLVLLGMGPDAHTASLFPETTVLEEQERWVAASWVEKFKTHRITLTPKVFNAAKRIVFMVSGLDKAKAMQSVLEGPYLPSKYPAQTINPVQGDVFWLMDQAAGSELKKTPLTEWDRNKGMVM